MRFTCFSPNSAFWLLFLSFLVYGGAPGSSEERDFLPGDEGVLRDAGPRHLPSMKPGDQLPQEELEKTRPGASSLAKDGGVEIIPPDLSHAMRAVALVISRGRTETLVGQTVRLTNISPEIHSPPLPLSATFDITLSLGLNETVLVALADGVSIRGFFCIGFFVLAANPSLSPTTLPAAFEAELNRPRDALSEGLKAAVAEGKRLFWSQYMADIAGAPLVTLVGDVFVLARVVIIGGYSQNAGPVLSRRRFLPHTTREYLARRLLMLFLLLQQAGIAHEDFDVMHNLLRRGGSSILSILSAFSRFGEEVRKKLSSVTSPFTAPELFLATQKSGGTTRLSKSEDALSAKSAADMWSLGAMLYYVFTGKVLARGTTHSSDDSHGGDNPSAQLPKAEGQEDDLDSILKACAVPARWRELIMKLLRPREKGRLSAEEVLTSFPDLLGMSS
ncbi:hypothetical protein Emed_006370 [Eimeria media]